MQVYRRFCRKPQVRPLPSALSLRKSTAEPRGWVQSKNFSPSAKGYVKPRICAYPLQRANSLLTLPKRVVPSNFCASENSLGERFLLYYSLRKQSDKTAGFFASFAALFFQIKKSANKIQNREAILNQIQKCGALLTKKSSEKFRRIFLLNTFRPYLRLRQRLLQRLQPWGRVCRQRLLPL